MIFSSGTKKPKVHSSAYVAPTATISGDVTIGAECAVQHGAVVTAEGAPVTIGTNTVVMENAVLKASGGSVLQYALSIGDRCIVGPHAYVVGATIGDGCFIASGARVFNGATLEDGSGVAPGATVEMGERVTAGPGASTEHLTKIFNVESGDDARARAAQTYAKFLRKAHAQDAPLEDHRNVKPVPRRRSGEEPPPTQATQVDKVVDVMMLELEEMEHRRQEAIKRQRGG
jgi:carbonic anhydrase/acetyltransferase-like protein (isoleucine patch superfamily)